MGISCTGLSNKRDRKQKEEERREDQEIIEQKRREQERKNKEKEKEKKKEKKRKENETKKREEERNRQKKNKKINLNKTIIEKQNPENLQQLDSFIAKTEIQDSFFEKNNYNNDAPYSELKKLEKEELVEQFQLLSKEYEKEFLEREKPKLNSDINLIKDIVKIEDSENFYKNKIIE